MTDYIYKICSQDIWEQSAAKGVFTGSGIDLIDGFIHFSTADQTAQTAHLHFNGVEDLVLVKTRCDGLDIKWEASRGGDLFPHLYGPLPINQVEVVIPMPVDENGNHILPREITPLAK